MAVANTYDNAGNMTGQTRYSNLAETTVVAATSYAYDAANQMTGITDKIPAARRSSRTATLMTPPDW